MKWTPHHSGFAVFGAALALTAALFMPVLVWLMSAAGSGFGAKWIHEKVRR